MGLRQEEQVVGDLLPSAVVVTVTTSPVTKVTLWVAEGLACTVSLLGLACAGACRTAMPVANENSVVAAEISCRRRRRNAEA
ncbi:hypothetical protein [Streptomyces chryseus]|uniref:hypothetical protein n=1 Tax=Streptomyces chryseus TaxID=68186 RepID=UPI00142EE64E|nr:hypothetical protein [Streptomyces chryseus]GGX25145.1 hypothetical protein GCM10010353_45040 [Streptomyces chryseus]